MFRDRFEITDYDILKRRTRIPGSTDFLGMTAPPHGGGKTVNGSFDGGYSPGVALVAQYVEQYLFRKMQYARIKDPNLAAVQEMACGYDGIDAGDLPSCRSVMRAFIDKGYVSHTNGVGYISPDTDDIKYFTYQYGGVVIEMKATDAVLNGDGDTHLGCYINSAGSLVSEGVTKGFLTCGYNAGYLFLQNSLGTNCGSMGFHFMPWYIVSQLALRCWTFRLT